MAGAHQGFQALHVQGFGRVFKPYVCMVWCKIVLGLSYWTLSAIPCLHAPCIRRLHSSPEALNPRCLGGQAALAYDLAALKFRGPDAATNYDTANYVQELLQFNDVRAPALPEGHTHAEVLHDMVP